jgi:hypothetical protein
VTEAAAPLTAEEENAVRIMLKHDGPPFTDRLVASLLATLDAERARHARLCRLIVSYADGTHDAVVNGGDWRDITREWRQVVEEARAATEGEP